MHPVRTGKFITLEGGEGVGKSTQLEAVRTELLAAGLEVVVTREPGGTPRAEQIRDLLLARGQETMPESCELLLMFAARATHLHNLILPSLQCGAWVLCDRFTDASYAYQGYGRGLSLQHIAHLEQWVQKGLQPDLTLLLDAPVELAMQRARARNLAQGHSEGDRFEIEQNEFFERVRQGYHARAAADPGRFRMIDAGQPLALVTESVRVIIRQFLAQPSA
ncbi:MAG: dTMP kinase [Steroidobacteraceae bacterium]